jgi:Protein of unknown function (DUF3551)
MRRIGSGTVLLAALALSVLSIPAAHADPYRWCAHIRDLAGGEVGNECYYYTLKQCRDTISGIGGYCEPNPFYDGRPVVDEYSSPQPAPPRYRRR